MKDPQPLLDVQLGRRGRQRSQALLQMVADAGEKDPCFFDRFLLDGDREVLVLHEVAV